VARMWKAAGTWELVGCCCGVAVVARHRGFLPSRRRSLDLLRRRGEQLAEVDVVGYCSVLVDRSRTAQGNGGIRYQPVI
jgi:hypothetical protein